jgi:hypothetical protein
MWICPQCRQRFFNVNQAHSCGHFTVEQFLRGKSEKAVRLFHAFLAAYRRIGPFHLHPVKRRVALVTKIRFCAINRVGRDSIDVHLVLTKQYGERPCFFRIDNLGDRFFIHHLRLHDAADLTKEIRSFMAMAYRVGNRAHIHPARTSNPGKRASRKR